MKRVPILLAALLCLAAPSAALAARHRGATLAPPGNSGVSQYLETVPTDAGQAPPKTGAPAGGLSKSGQHALSHLGSAGRLLGAVVSETSQPPAASQPPSPVSHPKRHRIVPAARPPASATSVASDPLPEAGHGTSPVAAVLSASTGAGSGLGWLIPLIVVSAAIAAALGVVRRRTAQG